jgi:dTMP kinase
MEWLHLFGKLIVLDGADGVGKTTQTELLVSKLREEGIHVAMFDFPRYKESLFGNLVGRCLAGEFGDFVRLSPYLASLPFTLDRVGAKEDLLRELSSSCVVCNRYVPSNIAYQAAKLPDGEKDVFIEFLDKAEYDELGLPRPWRVIYLSLPVHVARTLIKGRERSQDQHERDLLFQERVGMTYMYLSQKYEGWRVINCTHDGKVLPKEEIHEKILDVLR